MIPDPINTLIHNVTGTAHGSIFSQAIDMMAFGPGSQTSRKGTITGIPGLVVNCLVKHEQTKSGRRRSSLRMDSVAAAGTILADDPLLTPHSASAYIVVDRLESDTLATKLMVDTALSALIHALVFTKASSGVAFVPTTTASDFLNGEP